MGIRDWELRFALGGVTAWKESCGGDMIVTCVASALDGWGLPKASGISLRDLRCVCELEGRGVALFRFIPSNEGVTPKYQAVGDDGEGPWSELAGLSVNIGFGLCMLPSDPRLGLSGGIPYPVLFPPSMLVLTARISPNNGFLALSGVVGLRLVID